MEYDDKVLRPLQALAMIVVHFHLSCAKSPIGCWWIGWYFNLLGVWWLLN